MKIEYVLDKLVMDARLPFESAQRILDKLARENGYGSVVILKSWQSSKIQSFRENLTVTLEDGNSFYIGMGANWEQKNQFSITVRLEFNPAKVRNHVVFRAIHHDVVSPAKYIDFKRFDVAVNIPVDRRDIWLRKDRRTYKLYQNSESDKTEYLGQRSEHGQVKLYNKQMEAKLDYPLTRLELTVDYEKCSWEEFERIWPEVTYSDTGQLKMDDFSMNGTDRVLLMTCLEYPEYLRMLERTKGKKIECIMQRYTHKLEPDMKNYNMILSDILTFGKSIYGGGLQEYLEIKGLGW